MDVAKVLWENFTGSGENHKKKQVERMQKEREEKGRLDKEARSRKENARRILA